MLDFTEKDSGDDDYNLRLSMEFLAAVRAQLVSPSLSPQAYGIPDKAHKVLERLSMVGNLPFLLGPELEPIASRLMLIKGPSDRLNPYIVADQFEDFPFNAD